MDGLQPIRMFVQEEQVAALQAAVAAAVPSTVHPAKAFTVPASNPALNLPSRVELAWHLRQRDTRKACRMAEQLLPLTEPGVLQARLYLVLGEGKWLFAELEAAAAMAATALAQFGQAGDASGCCDAWWLQSAIAIDLGQHDESSAALAAAASAARATGDALRAALCEAAQARWAVLSDARAAHLAWNRRLNFFLAETEPSLAVWIEDYLALVASAGNDYAQSVLHFVRAHQAALATGQIRAAIIAATNMAEDYSRLSDHHTALEQMQLALELARPTSWPRSIGACLMHTAETMRQLSRFDAAQELLEEALQVLQPLANARSYAHALQYRGDLALDRADFALALDSFSRLEQRADALQQLDFKCVALRGQAQALSGLGRGDDAQQRAARALRQTQKAGDLSGQIASLQVLAEIHARYDLPLQEQEPTTPAAASSSLHYLLQAVQLAEAIPGYCLSHQMLDMLAREYARVSQFENAYLVALQAAAMRERSHSDQATNRAIAMQISHQTERARADGEYHRQLAQAEARRAEVLQQVSSTLEHLSAVGQEVTAHLDPNLVCQVLHRHVQGMLPASLFAIHVSSDDGGSLRRCFAMLHGRSLAQSEVALNPQTCPKLPWLECAAKREMVLLDGVAVPDLQEETGIAAASLLCVPLVVNERLVGVMCIAVERAHAYGERECLVFRTLCAYGAIALDNAYAYLRLQEAQEQLVSQEKLAALGALVAGVAHELNTPIGNSLTIASTLQGKSDEIESKIQGPGVKRSEIMNYVRETRDASQMMVRGLGNAAELLHSFKQVAMDRTTAQKRVFELLQTTQEIVATLMNQIRRAGHKIEIDIPPGLKLDSYPGPYGQVITNFINNALLHAFENRREGQMRIEGRAHGNDQVRLSFRDNGGGIKPEFIKRIFEPFFTTKLGQGGSGLGLSISYNIVTSILHGQISVQSTPDAGTSFTLLLPLVVEDKTE